MQTNCDCTVDQRKVLIKFFPNNCKLNHMFFSKRRILLIGTIVAVVAFIVLIPLITSLLTSPNIDEINISLSDVQINNIDNITKTIDLSVILNIYNSVNQKTATTSKIDYNLYANGIFLGNGILSFEDIPPNGRPQLSPGSTVTLKSKFTIFLSPSNKDLVDKLIQKSMKENFTWKIDGNAQIESAFVFVPKTFSDTLLK